MSSMGVYGIVLAGWSASSPYSLLGGLRSSAQVISYEIAMGLAFVPVFLYAGSLSTTAIVQAQAHGTEFHWFGVGLHYPSWFAVLLLPSFLIYLVTMVGETNRLPFDLPEGEGELVARLPHRVLLAEVRAVLPGRVRQHDHGVRRWPSRCSWAAGGRRGRSRCGRTPTRAGGRCSGSSAKCRSSCSCSSGSAARCRGSATTS